MNFKLFYFLLILILSPLLVKSQEEVLLIGSEVIDTPHPLTPGQKDPCLSGDSIKSFVIQLQQNQANSNSYLVEIRVLDFINHSPLSIITPNGAVSFIKLSGSIKAGTIVQVPDIKFARQGRHRVWIEYQVYEIRAGGRPLKIIRKDEITFCKRDIQKENPERTKIEQDLCKLSIPVSPNPTSGYFRVTIPNLNLPQKVSLISVSGKECFAKSMVSIQQKNDFYKIDFDLTSVPQGIYYLIIVTTTGQTYKAVVHKE